MHTDWINTAEAREFSGYNAEYIRRLVRNGKIRGEVKGHDLWIDKKSLLQFLKTTGRKGKEDKRHGPRTKGLTD